MSSGKVSHDIAASLVSFCKWVVPSGRTLLLSRPKTYFIRRQLSAVVDCYVWTLSNTHLPSPPGRFGPRLTATKYF